VLLSKLGKPNNVLIYSVRKFNCKIKQALVGKGYSKKQKFYCNDRNKSFD